MKQKFESGVFAPTPTQEAANFDAVPESPEGMKAYEKAMEKLDALRQFHNTDIVGNEATAKVESLAREVTELLHSNLMTPAQIQEFLKEVHKAKYPKLYQNAA